jgi:hypothetical protein
MELDCKDVLVFEDGGEWLAVFADSCGGGV